MLVVGMFLLVVFFVEGVSAATKVLDYGFEDWTGDADTTPNYIFSSSTSTYWNSHLADSEVITSYTPNGYSQWTPYTGTYFLLRSDANGLDPAVDGITASSVNDHSNMGYEGAYGGGYSFDIDDIDTGEFFIRFWARIVGFDTVPSGPGCKWIRLYTDGADTDHIYAYNSR